jgi:hypothetical protein
VGKTGAEDMLSIFNIGKQGAASLLPSLSAAGLRIITTSAAVGAEAAAAPSSKSPLMKEFQVYRYNVIRLESFRDTVKLPMISVIAVVIEQIASQANLSLGPAWS